MKRRTSVLGVSLLVAGSVISAPGLFAYLAKPARPGGGGAVSAAEKPWACLAANDPRGFGSMEPLYNGPSCDDAARALKRRVAEPAENLPVLDVYLAGPFEDAHLEPLGGVTTLKRLTLFATNVTDAGLHHVAKSEGLEHLFLFKAPVSDDGMKLLGGLTSLRFLDLSYTRVTGAGLAHLAAATELQELNLHSVRVDDAGMANLQRFVNLETLDLTDTAITDAGLEPLKGLSQLKKLRLGGNRLTDSGLRHLEGLTGLKDLDLDSTTISDAGLEHLTALRGLQSLSLDGTRVTDVGVSRLQHALPDLGINRLPPWKR